ncbi:MAG: hypothetical protein MUO82_03130 [Candidatus Thermoplasmatota archaeon]|nr:hypothetical protein [Candidatus Thermoplasmatota archaeon]
MGLLENENFEEDLLIKKQDKKILKEKILDENYKKASMRINKIKTEEKLKSKKKPFFKLGLILIIFGLICLLIINFIPWAYAIYDNKTSNLENNEIFYYSDKIDNFSNDTNFSSFFESKDSYKYLGVNSYTLKLTSSAQSFIIYEIIALGCFFTIIGIFIKGIDFSIEKYKLFHCFFALITTILGIYLIFITIKFMGANILVFYNANFISDNIQNLAFIFISPIALLFITSGLIYMTFTVLKINFNDFEKIFEEKKKNKSLKILNYGVK